MLKATLLICVISIASINFTKEKNSSPGDPPSTLRKSGLIQEELVAGKVQGRWFTLIDVCKKKRFKITYQADLFPDGTTIYVYFVNAACGIVAIKSFPCVPDIKTTVLQFTWGIPLSAQKVLLSTFRYITAVTNVPCGERPTTTPDYEDAYVTTYDCIEPCD